MLKIEVFGPGCRNCRRLFENAEKAVALLEVDAEVSKVEDMRAIAMAGVMTTPALGIDGKLLFQGRVPGPGELSELLDAALAAPGPEAGEA